MIEYLQLLLADRRRQMDERGASAVEYGLLIAGIAAFVIVAALLLGPAVAGQFDNMTGQIGGDAGGGE